MHKAADLAAFLSVKYSEISAFPTQQGGVCFEFVSSGVEVILTVNEDVILLEAYDESDADLRSQAFFAVTPKLLSNLDDLRGFVE